MTSLSEMKRKNGGWSESHIATWTEYNTSTAYISCVFSWDLAKAKRLAKYYRSRGFRVRAGGPAVTMNPDALDGIAELGGQIDALSRHNPDATFTSRGCIRKCAFCAVPKIEGDLVELDDWAPKRLVCDNNLLACSRAHFDRVIDCLKNIKGIDFNQGLDARLLTKHHAERIRELDLYRARLSWDNVQLESRFMRAWAMLRNAGIPKRSIAVYVLIGFNDTPEDAEYRLRTVRDLGGYPNPMRYQPVGAMQKNDYVAPGWTNDQLQAFVRYWSSLRLGKIPFSEWLDSKIVQQRMIQLSF